MWWLIKCLHMTVSCSLWMHSRTFLSAGVNRLRKIWWKLKYDKNTLVAEFAFPFKKLVSCLSPISPSNLSTKTCSRCLQNRSDQPAAAEHLQSNALKMRLNGHNKIRSVSTDGPPTITHPADRSPAGRRPAEDAGGTRTLPSSVFHPSSPRLEGGARCYHPG